MGVRMRKHRQPSAVTRECRAAIYATVPFPSERAHVGAIVGMANAAIACGYSTTLYAFFRPNARQVLYQDFGLSPEVKLGWHSAVRSKVGFVISAAGWAMSGLFRRYDLVLTRNPLFALLSLRSRRVVLELHQEPKTAFSRARFDNQVLPLLRGNRLRIVYISHNLRDKCQNKFPRLKNLPSMVLASGFREDLFPSEWSPSPRNRRITYLGSLYPGRGVSLIIEVARRVPNAEFHVIGGTIHEWQRLTTSFAVPQNCRHFGRVPHIDVVGRLLDSDILIAPYEKNVFVSSGDNVADAFSPLKVVEYLAAGRAIVASDLPLIRELVDPSTDAVLVTPDDATSWAREISALLDAHEKRDSLGRAAFDKAREELSWNDRMRRVQLLLEG